VLYVFLDRDGTLIRHVPYLSAPAQVELLPGVIEGLGALIESGCKLFLHTNQSGIGRGYFPLEAAVAVNDEMVRQIGLGENLFVDICICPETPGQEIVYRKPSPRYAREMMTRYGADAGQLRYVGDNLSDLQTAKNVGCSGIGVSTGVHDLAPLLAERGLAEFPVFASFALAARHIVAGRGSTDVRT
jgi:D-glycero-D-manno-heptose 1,7-bisphosphate phosphatase